MSETNCRAERRPRLIVAGTGSGSGKTTVTLGLMRAYARRGLRVQGFKCGPDYIDPAYHSAAAGCEARNLDAWMTPEGYVQEYFLRTSGAADLSVIEGVMGLYDGKGATGLAGSTAEIAILTESPVVLVVDARSMGRSAAAVVLGFQRLEPRVNLAAVIVNRCGSREHYSLVQAAIEAACGIPVIGWLPRNGALQIPERHLGLLPAVERGELEGLFGLAADSLEAGTNLDRLLQIASEAPPFLPGPAAEEHPPGSSPAVLPAAEPAGGAACAKVVPPANSAAGAKRKQATPPAVPAEGAACAVTPSADSAGGASCAPVLSTAVAGGGAFRAPALSPAVSAAGAKRMLQPTAAAAAPVLAVARDAAFNFYYADNLELLAEAGARLVFFSPLAGEGIPAMADGIMLGGGFPEEFAAEIAGNTAFLGGLRRAATAGMPLYAECGGYMVLARSLTDRAGARHEMAGIIPAATIMRERRVALGYREVTALQDHLLLREGECLRGHEFHYSEMIYDGEAPGTFAYSSTGRTGTRPEGYAAGNVLAAYTHIHLASYRPAGLRLVEACRNFACRKPR
ncbi:cobyrinate a,c-diamide synthase [Paenibacillus tepidiphilus]|uniref:cobyrinate a,c-diamide synthase n=1 Tax=Paenibacillus tepidiphilus TaxID=2608683 RepID=UPI00123B730A|nr:cobyrinate a,c-diamide synthase [Paenibacillus tepidiphilus]